MMHRSHNSAAALAVALILSVIGASVFNILPLLGAAAADTLGFSDRQVGVLSSTICVAAGASALLAGIWVRSVHWPRAALFGLGGLLATNLLAMLVHRYWVFVLVLGASGFFASAVFSLAMTILSDRHESARGFGVSTALQVGYQVAALLAGPTLLRLVGVNGVLAMLAAPAGLAMLLVPQLPARGRSVVSEGEVKALLKPATLLALAGFGTFFVSVGAFWTYVELMGQARGMTARVVANCVAVGLLAGVLGGVLSWAFGARFGRLWPLGIAAVLTVASALLLNDSLSVSAFVVSGLLYFFAWNYSYAYQVDIVNAVDATGRGVAITQAFGFLGVAGGAGLAAFFVTPGDYHAVIWLVVVAVCMSTALFGLSSIVHRYVNAQCGAPISVRTD